MIDSHLPEALAAIEATKRARLEATGILLTNAQKRKIVEYEVIDTGRTLSSVTYEVGEDEVQVGTNVDYAIYPALGTRNVPPRNWLVDGAQEAIGEIQGIWGASI